MKVTTETISTDPWKFAATAMVDDVEYTYIGDEDESRAQCRRRAISGLQAKLDRMYGSRN